MEEVVEKFKKKLSNAEILDILATSKKVDKIVADFRTFGYIPVIVPGMIGNILIIVYFWKINNEHVGRMSTYHFLIILLAITDLIVIAVTGISSVATDGKTITDQVHIQLILWAMRSGSASASCWMLVLLSYERYRSIVHPFKRRLKKKYAFYFGICVWCACISAQLSTFLVYEKNRNRFPIFLVAVCMDCFLPSIALLFFYWRISTYLSKNDLSSNTNQVTSSDDETKSRRNTNRSANKTIRNLAILYVCLVWPSRILGFAVLLIAEYGIVFYCQNQLFFGVLVEILCIFTLVNNAVNVFVYAIMIDGFKSFLWRLMCYCRK